MNGENQIIKLLLQNLSDKFDSLSGEFKVDNLVVISHSKDINKILKQ